MRWLIRRDTRAARVTILRLRLKALQFGDDFAETYLALICSIFGFVPLLPGDTTGTAPAWHTINRILGGDLGVGALFTTLAAALTLAALRLITDQARQFVLVTAMAVWVGMSVGFFTGYAWSLGPWTSLLNAAAAWLAYLRSDTE